MDERNRKIITLTLSPAFDMHCRGEIALKHENLITPTACQAGGKGVNISRALSAGAIENRALVLLGEDNMQTYLQELEKEGLNTKVFTTPGRIRDNITVHSRDGSETRICFPGFTAGTDVWEQIESYLIDEAGKDTFVTMTGRIPDGIGLSKVKALLIKLVSKGTKTVIDSRSFGLDDLKEAKPWLIKPNREEIYSYLGGKEANISEVTALARSLHKAGIENVMVSLGGDGAVLICKEGTFFAKPPKINAISTVGAGDSTIAGFIAAMCRENGAKEALRTAVAYGTAACMTEGTLPPEAETIREIRTKVQVSGISKI